MLQRHDAFETKLRRCPLESGDSHRIIERIVQPAQMNGMRFDCQMGLDQSQVMTLAGAEHHAVLAQPDRVGVTVDGAVPHCDNRHQAPASVIWPAETSSVQTLKLSSVLGPKVVAIATSHASRPRAIRTRPTRGTLLRGSKVCHSAPIHASKHAAKSPTASGG